MTHQIFPGMLSVAAAALSDEEKHLLEKINPVGVSLFARNISSPQQLCRLTREIKETIGRPDVLIAVDQEGGRVRRLAEPYFPSYAGQQTLGRLYTEISAETARNAASLQAALIAAGKIANQDYAAWKRMPVEEQIRLKQIDKAEFVQHTRGFRSLLRARSKHLAADAAIEWHTSPQAVFHKNFDLVADNLKDFSLSGSCTDCPAA